MRTVEIGGRKVELAGSIMAPLTWYNEFHDDGLFRALLAMEGARMPMLDVLRVAWVMAHDADVAAGREAMGFDRWVSSVAGEADFSALRGEVMAESEATWFRAAAEQARAAAADAAGREGTPGQ